MEPIHDRPMMQRNFEMVYEKYLPGPASSMTTGIHCPLEPPFGELYHPSSRDFIHNPEAASAVDDIISILKESYCIPYNEETLPLILKYIDCDTEALRPFMKKKNTLIVTYSAPQKLQSLLTDVLLIVSTACCSKERALLALIDNGGGVVSTIITLKERNDRMAELD